MEALPEDTKLQEVDRQLEEEADEMEAKVGNSNTVLSYTPEHKRSVSLTGEELTLRRVGKRAQRYALNLGWSKTHPQSFRKFYTIPSVKISFRGWGRIDCCIVVQCWYGTTPKHLDC